MKKTLISIGVATLIALPLNAIEVYNNNDAKVNVYGSVKGLTGYGLFKNNTKKFGISNTLFSLQGNSRLGVSANIGGLFSTAELGVKNDDGSNTIASGFRHLYAGYNFGENYGTLLVGKTTSIAGTDFSSDLFFQDSGLVGFGNGTQGERRFQVQYASPYGVSFAVMENRASKEGNGQDKDAKAVTIPVFALSYDFIGLDDNLIAKIGASYTLVNAKTDASKTEFGNTANHRVEVHAYAINVAATYKLLNKSLYFTAMAGYGVNANLYSDAITPTFGKFDKFNDASDLYGNKIKISNNKLNEVSMASAALEVGYNITDSLKAIVGGGFQFSRQNVKGHVFDLSRVKSYGAFVQVPYTLNQFVAFKPSVGYYGIESLDRTEGKNTLKTSAQILAAVQTVLSF